MAKRFEFIILSRECKDTDAPMNTLADIAKVVWMCTRGGALEDTTGGISFSEMKKIELEVACRDHQKALGLLDPPKECVEEFGSRG